jgi:hypothetical protein
MRTPYIAASILCFVFGCGAGGDPQGTTSTASSSEGGQSGDGGGSGNGDGGSGSNTQAVSVSVGTGSFGGEECGRSAFGAQVPASILIVLDKSGSMAGLDGAPDKWFPTVSALTTLTQTAPPELNLGLLPFPADDCNPASVGLTDGCCTDVSPAPVVQVKPLATSGPEIVTWLNANGPTNGTPTLWALKYGYNILKTLTTEGERFLLLVTDGAPNVAENLPLIGPVNQQCGVLEDMIAETAAASGEDPVVKTFVIGAPGSESAASFFGQIEEAGLTAPNGYFQIGSANYEADLQAALDAITGLVSDCVFALPDGEDIDPNKVNVVIETADGQEIEVFRDEAHVDGWDYTDASQDKIQLFGPACELYKSAAQNRITIILGCETVVK